MEENKVPAEHLTNWLALYRDMPKIQTDIGGIDTEDGNSQTSCWLSFRLPDGVDVKIQLAAKPTQPFPSIVAKTFVGNYDELADQIGRWVDEQTGGAPRKRSSGTCVVHSGQAVSDFSVKADAKAIYLAESVAMRGATILPTYRTSKRVRILATNGQKTLDLFFIRRQKDDLYYGVPHDVQKFSYHASGKQHLEGKRGVKQQERWSIPLSMIEEHYHLINIGYDIHAVLNDTPIEKCYTGKKSDAVVYIDARSIPPGVMVNLSIGLIKEGRLDRLPLTSDLKLICQQVTLFTGFQPWVYIRVAWPQK